MHNSWTMGWFTGKQMGVYASRLYRKIKISVRYAGVVDCINLQTYFKTGETLTSSCGGKGGNRTDTICIDYPDEYLISVSGRIGNYEGSDVVVSICFDTNQNRYGPYGTGHGKVFSYDGEGGAIVGFHGRSNKYLNAIGVYVRPESLALGLNAAYESKLIHEPCSSMSRSAMPRDAGPWGACGGKPWDDGVFSTIKQVRVLLGELNAIYALQFEYLNKDGKSVLSQIHGSTGGLTIQLVDLDVKDEYLTGVSGFYGPVKGYDGMEAIASISFHTNKKIHGPYGDDRGFGCNCYCSTAYPGKVTGFHVGIMDS
ncbi:agglutinin-like [Bidens hawaiensis]|uniref:agglutinin-like n=1 Tax=Bidens hawaiensis TaxID=980011 RepID=UPI00404AA614